MKQNKIRTDLKYLIIFAVWTILAGVLYLIVATYDGAEAEKLLFIFKILIGIFYFPVVLFPFVLFFVHRYSKAKGEGRPLSLEAMYESKKHIPDTIYKFCSLTSKKSDTSLNQIKLNTLKNNEIWLSSCCNLNDPFEGQMFMLPEKDFLQNGVPNEIKERYNVKNAQELINLLSGFRNKYCQTSFSSVNKNVRMWGYYANGCRGYCVEYKVLNKELLFPVCYINKRIILSGFFKSKRYERQCKSNLNQIYKSTRKLSANDRILYYLYIQSFKNTQWAFEKEIRAIDITLPDYNGGNQPIESYGLQPTKIIAGYLSEYIEDLKHIAIQLGVSFSIMKPNYESNKFELVEEKIF